MSYPNSRPQTRQPGPPPQPARPHPMEAIDRVQAEEDLSLRRPRRCRIHDQDMIHLMAGVYSCPHCH